jgi:hypothetical protein
MDRDKSMVKRMVAGIAAGAELVESRVESGAVLDIDCFFESGDRSTDVAVYNIAAEEFGHVVEPLLQLPDFVVGEPPVARVMISPTPGKSAGSVADDASAGLLSCAFAVSVVSMTAAMTAAKRGRIELLLARRRALPLRRFSSLV